MALIFVLYSRRIIAKARPSDPNYLKLCVAVGQIEQWMENRYPSWIFGGPSGGLRSNIPLTRDDPSASSIEDARVRQLPSAFASNGRRAARPQNEEENKMSREDWQILL